MWWFRVLGLKKNVYCEFVYRDSSSLDFVLGRWTKSDGRNRRRRGGARFANDLLGTKNQSNDKTVETQSLSENEDEDHADEKLLLLGSGTNTSVTNNTDGHTGSETTETDRKTSTEMCVSRESRVAIVILNC